MISAKSITFEYDTAQVLHNTSFSVSQGDRIGLVGSNGAGKSTLLKILAGILLPFSGKVHKPTNLHIGYMPQEIAEDAIETCQQYLEDITGVKSALATLDAATKKYGENNTPATQQAYENAYSAVEALEAYTFESRIAKVFSRVGLDIGILSKPVSQLSGGQKTKLLLAAVLLSRFDIYLLDEPTNNLDIEGIEILEKFIHNSDSGFVIISHDRRLLRNCTTKIAELTNDKAIQIYTLGYEEYIEAKHSGDEAALQRYSEFLAEQKRLKDAATQKTQVARAASGNKRSSDGDKMGNNARKEKATKAHARAAAALQSRLSQIEVVEKPFTQVDLDFEFGITESNLPLTVIEATNAVTQYNDETLGPYNITIGRGEKVIFVGKNGSGKTTLLKLLTGLTVPSSGEVNIASGVVVGYVDQNYQFSDPQASIVSNIVALTGSQVGEVYNVLARFGIGKLLADSKPNELSPGQRSRAFLASLVLNGTNVLLLDEPTNHLDILASDELQSAINSYSGTVVIVTHDRELITSLEDKKVYLVEDGTIASSNKAEIYMKKLIS